MLREFILGSNTTGLVQDDGTTVGGIDSSLLPDDILQGQSSILYGSGTATSEFLAPSESIASWESYFSAFIATTPAASATSGA